MARFLDLRNMSLLYEFMQRIASAYNGKQIMEIKQLDLSGGQEFMCIQKERVGGLFISV